MAIIRTGLPTLTELIDLVNCYNFSVSNHLTQMVNFPTRIPDCGFHSPALLDCIPVVVLKNCEPELSFILTELFSKCLKESCFPDCWKVSSAFPVFKNVGERSTAKNYRPVSLLSVVSKLFEKLVNNRIVDHL